MVWTAYLLGSTLDAAEVVRPLSGFVHRAWTLRAGAPGEISSIAQTSDGLIWIASGSGLFHFDGIRFVPLQDNPAGTLSLNAVYSLYAPPTGGLWVGLRYGGLVFIKDDAIVEYPPGGALPSSTITALAQDHSGILWGASPTGLVRFRDGHWERLDESWGVPPGYAATLYVDRSGALWVSLRQGLYVLRSGAHRFEKDAISPLTHFSSQLGTLAESRDGTLWVADIAKNVKPTRGDRTVLFHDATSVQFDQDGVLWYSTGEDVRRLINAREVADGASPLIEQFGRSDGLLGDVSFFFKDRDGDIWVGSGEGIDLFVPTSLRIARPVPGEFAMARGPDGAMWWAEADYKAAKWHINHFVNDTVVEMLSSDEQINCAYTDPEGKLWLAGPEHVWQFDGKQLSPLSNSLSGLATQSMVRARDGSLWRSIARQGVFQYVNGEWKKSGGLSQLPDEPALIMAGDERGRLWFGYTHNRLALVEGHRVSMLGAAEGVNVGNVTAIAAWGEHVWVAGDSGLLRLEGHRFVPVRVPGDNPYRSTWGLLETQAGELWTAGGRALTRLDRSQLSKVVAGQIPEKPPQVFDYRDGLVGLVQGLRPAPSLAEAADGRIWFALTNGLGFLDPNRLPAKTAAPPVLIEAINAAGHSYSPFQRVIKLPPLTTQLRIGYTAASFSAPERVRFRYRLEGLDESWQDAGELREAIYTNLGPGRYRFRVGAANRDSAWSELDESLDIQIAAAFYQTRWFYALVGVAAFALLTLLYRIRVRQVRFQVQSRLEERLSERERIARELHDTLLQGFQALMLRLQAAAMRLKSEPLQAQELIEQALHRADTVLEEGRDRVQNLRTTRAGPTDLAQIFQRIAENEPNHQSKVRVTVEGTPRELHRIVREEVERIGTEAMRNALHHSNAARIEVDITFLWRRFVLRVSDDGIGIDSRVLLEGRERHFGLTGMRERAQRIKGVISIASKPHNGTEIELIIPAVIAYVGRQSWFARSVRGWSER